MKDQTRAAVASSTTARSLRTRAAFSSAYTSTKHAITGLTKATNLDGRAYDIAVGQVDSAMPAPMTDHGRRAAADGRKISDLAWAPIGDAVAYMAGLPLDANVLFMTVMASKMPFVGRG
jgi:NADP-dependent 3-hydroxy acid dehydrogenase YdfG